MPNATGSVSVNLNRGKRTIIILRDTASRFTEDTIVVNPVTDTVNAGVTFHGTALWNKGGRPDRLPVRLVGRRGSSVMRTDPPDTGTLAITLSDPNAPIPVTPVVVPYVDDDEIP